jgi:nucleotide-binding universal stress UspA family protein
MKSILVLVGGSNSDEAVFETAMTAARPFGAHSRFLHAQVSAGRAAAYSPHTDFAGGLALRNALADLETESHARSVAAARHVHEFCAHAMVELSDQPRLSSRMTASFIEEHDVGIERILFHGRHSDLIVTARSSKSNGLPPDFLELLLLRCGRPVLVASPNWPERMDRIVVAWKDSAEAARAVAAATPLLAQAKKVVFVGVEENNNGVHEAIHDLVQQIGWHGILAETEFVSSVGRTVEEEISATARRWSADLIVLGAYGHARFREILFGGCTQAFIFGADRAIFFMH